MIGDDTMGRRKKEIMPTILTKKCVHCGMDLEYRQFHKSKSDIYMGNNNLFPVCKDCLKILYEQYRIQYVNQFSVLGTKPEENVIEKLAIRRL